MKTKEILLSLWAESNKITPELFSEDGTIIKPDLVRQEMDALQKSMPEGKPKELSRKVLEAGEKQFMQWFKDHFIPEYSGRSDCREILCVYLKRWWCGQTLFNKHISQAEARDLIFRENSENAAWEITYHRLDYAFRQAGIEGDAL